MVLDLSNERTASAPRNATVPAPRRWEGKRPGTWWTFASVLELRRLRTPFFQMVSIGLPNAPAEPPGSIGFPTGPWGNGSPTDSGVSTAERCATGRHHCWSSCRGEPVSWSSSPNRASPLRANRGELRLDLVVEYPEPSWLQAGDVLVKRIDEDGERQVALELGRGSRQDDVTAGLGASGQLPEKPRLADPRFALQRPGPARANRARRLARRAARQEEPYPPSSEPRIDQGRGRRKIRVRLRVIPRCARSRATAS